MLCLSLEGCRKSVMVKEKSCVLWTKESVVMGNEEERNARSYG